MFHSLNVLNTLLVGYFQTGIVLLGHSHISRKGAYAQIE